jgi:hypothetical protein
MASAHPSRACARGESNKGTGNMTDDPGTPGRLFIPASAGYIGEMGDEITVEGDDPDFRGLRRKWRGKVVEIAPEGVAIEGRFWISRE